MKSIIRNLVIVLFVSITLLGCSKLNRENYEKIKVGMLYHHVTTILGEPDTCDGVMGVKTCVWGDDKKNITIQFVTDKVIVPSMKGL